MTCAVILLLLLLFVVFAYFLLISLVRPSSPSVTQVIAVLRQVDESELRDLWNEPIEQSLRSSLPRTQFEQVQRARATLLFEYLRRMSFNSWVLLSWAYAEQERLHRPAMPVDEEKARIIGDLTEQSTVFRAYIVMTLPKLSWRLLIAGLRMRSIRNVARLQRIGGVDGLETYRRMTSAAVALGGAYGGDVQTQLLALLRGTSIPGRE